VHDVAGRPARDRPASDEEIAAGLGVRQISICQRAGGINFNCRTLCRSTRSIYRIVKSEKFCLAAGLSRHIKKACGVGDVQDLPQERENRPPAPFPIGIRTQQPWPPRGWAGSGIGMEIAHPAIDATQSPSSIGVRPRMQSGSVDIIERRDRKVQSLGAYAPWRAVMALRGEGRVIAP
jgi:hypothetical protein